MADVIKKATNKFTKGLIMDFSPENTRNEVLTHALNATLLTFNGNEFSLQNDMGNGRVETAYLPEGYMPVGTCEYGGIIYIVSYNPLEDKSLIGCFPSPERNISRDELGEAITESLDSSAFQEIENGSTTGKIINNSKYVLLKNNELHPGDKFIVTSDLEIYKNSLSDLYIKKDNEFILKEHPIIALNIVSIEEGGKIIYLNSSIKKYECDSYGETYKYHILGESRINNNSFNQQSVDLDSYRNVLNSGYSVFKLKTSGKLALLAELIMIDSYSVTHSLYPNELNGFDVILHHEVSPTVNISNWFTVPKLRYFYLKNSLGYLQTWNSNDEYTKIPLFDETNYVINENFLNTSLKSIFTSENSSLFSDNQTLLNTALFNFPKKDSYHGKIFKIDKLYDDDKLNNNKIITKFSSTKYHRINITQIIPKISEGIYDYDKLLPYYAKLNAKYYNYTSGDEHYSQWNKDDLKDYNGSIENLNLYIRFEKDTYIPYDKFIPNYEYNWIDGLKEHSDKAPYEEKLILYVIDDYIPLKPSEDLLENEYIPYDDIVLASIKLPEVLVRESIDLPFKYDYTITPCMNYGRLDHLSVSNTVDFSNLHQFNKSNFNIWKYRIDGDLIMLTFGTEVFDTYESDKVDSIILEFYDLWGFVGSLEISNKKSYNGLFTKVLYLNSLNTLSKKKINVNTYSENYQHNINITLKDGRYYINDKEVQFTSYDDGWRYTGTQNSDLESNDVGVLYHNLIYGVKAYLRRTKNKGTNNEELEFIKKQEFFLYTLPIFNDYYYTTENFNSITNPKLDFVLTYKLTDKSYKNEYYNEVINNGYYNLDKENVDNYLSGIYSGTELNSVKYYKYEGASKLYLEIGLKLDYSELGLSYDPNINNKFSCVLTLTSDTGDGTYSVGSDSEDVTIPNYILNYYNNDDVQILNNDNNDVNSLKFDNNSAEYPINSEFNKYNFLNNLGSLSINIIYNFVVGYSFNISKIVETQVPVTTVCALFHKKPDGEYNYDDFGIYESNLEDPEDSTKQALLSDNMFYNGGRLGTGYFGLCRLKSYLKEHIPSSVLPALDLEIIDKYTILYTPKPIYSPGASNASHMEELSSMIGKLTFCLPHVHSWGHNDNGVSIEYGLPKIGVDYETPNGNTITNNNYDDQVYPAEPFLENSKGDHLCNFENDTFYQNLKGTRRWLFMRNPDDDPKLADNEKLTPGHDDDYGEHGHYELWPHYNMAAITEESIELGSQFISALDYKEVYDGWSANKGKKVRAFTGLRGFELAVFNRKMLETMKSVYAFNPDYNSLTVNLGEVSIQNYNPYITSNIISTNSNLEFKEEEESLNDYIYMGTMKVSNYLKYLNENSKNDKGIGILILQENSEKLLPLLQFNAGLDYCGTTNNPYLVSSLTYNLPVPSDLQSELEFSNGDSIIVKNSLGINSTIKGLINKKTLYGYNTNCNKLVELDVSNYTIDNDGVLLLKNVTRLENAERIILNVPDNKIYNSYSTADPCKVSINYDFPTIGNIPLNFEFRVRIHSHDGYKKTGDNYYYSYDYPFYYNSDNIYENSVYISTGSNINVTSDVSGITFYAKIKKIILEYQGQVLKNFKDCRAMSSENYRDLFDDSISELVINGTTYNKSDIKIDTITKKSIYSGKELDLVPNASGYYEMGIDDALRSYTINDPNKEGAILVHKIKIHLIECEVIPTTIIDNLINEVVQIPKTEEYSETVNHVYRVKEAYKDSVIYGSSITINDLIYDGNSDGHRLFLDSRNYEYDKNLLGKLFYRQRAGEINAANPHYNNIFIYTGPCYTPETLIIKN